MDPSGARGDGTPGRAHTAATLLPYLVDKEKEHSVTLFHKPHSLSVF